VDEYVFPTGNAIIYCSCYSTPTTVAGEFNGTFPLNLEITARAYVTGTNYSEFLSESSAKVDTTQQLYALVLTTDKFPNIDIVVEATGDDTLYTYSAFGYIDDILPSNHQRINLTISRRLKPLPPLLLHEMMVVPLEVLVVAEEEVEIPIEVLFLTFQIVQIVLLISRSITTIPKINLLRIMKKKILLNNLNKKHRHYQLEVLLLLLR
jgi:hypothetical protein